MIQIARAVLLAAVGMTIVGCVLEPLLIACIAAGVLVAWALIVAFEGTDQ